MVRLSDRDLPAERSLRLLFPPEPAHMRGCGKAEARSAARPDDECLSPQEEAMELGESTKRVHFREPPSFQVGNPD